MPELIQVAFGRRVVLVNFEVAPCTVKYLVLTFTDYMLLQLTESLGCTTAAQEWTAYNHITLALLDMSKSVL